MSDRIGSDCIENVIGNKRIRIDDFMTIYHDLVIPIQLRLVTEGSTLDASPEVLVNDETLLGRWNEDRCRDRDGWGDCFDEYFFLGRWIGRFFVEGIGIEGRYEFIILIIKFGEDGLRVSHYRFLQVLPALQWPLRRWLRRTRVHTHTLQEVQIDHIKIQVDTWLLLLRVECRVPIEVL